MCKHFSIYFCGKNPFVFSYTWETRVLICMSELDLFKSNREQWIYLLLLRLFFSYHVTFSQKIRPNSLLCWFLSFSVPWFAKCLLQRGEGGGGDSLTKIGCGQVWGKLLGTLNLFQAWPLPNPYQTYSIQDQIAQTITIFQIKMVKNHTLSCFAYLCSPHGGVPPPTRWG